MRRSAWRGEQRRGTKCWSEPEVAPETMADLRVVCLLASNFLILKTVVMSLKKDIPLFRLTHKQKTNRSKKLIEVNKETNNAHF